MAANSQQFGTIRSDHAPRRGNEVNVSSLEQQLTELTSFVRQMAVWNGQTVKVCGICNAMGHATDMCPTLQEESFEHVNATGGFPGPPQRKYDPYSSTYNPGWKDHPNLRYRNQQGNQPGPQAPQQHQAYRPPYPPQPQRPQVPTPGEFLENIVKDLATNIVTFQHETRASIQHLNTQVGQLATAISRLEAQHSNALPSLTVVNPRENVSAITLRSGRELKVHEEEVQTPVKKEEVEESKIGVIEDVFVQVGNLIFPADFYVLDMKNNDLNCPTLLGRPFLKTSKSIIDVDNGTLTMEFVGEIAKFNIFDTLKNPSCESDVNILDVNDHLSQGQKKFVIEDKLKEIVVRPAENSNSKIFLSDLQASKTEPKLPLDRSKGIPKKYKKRKHETKLTRKLLKWVKVDNGTRYEPP
ncbi:uncharacterized protein [Henckelia pumila]|uniref:uncharacterized protein n=1 Tax=Henckelia pumila TaxID=405737 RepID=UPI003C6DE812